MQVDTAFLTVAEGAGDAIVLADPRGTIAYFNPAARLLFGYEAEEVVGKPVTMILPARFHEAYRRVLRRYLQDGRLSSTSRPIELCGRTKDGKEVPVEVSVSACRTVTEVLFVGFIRSIAERKQTEMLEREQLEQFRQDHTMKAVAKLAGGVAHEFNNLMTAVMGYADILAEELPQGSRHREMAEEISKAAENASGLTRQLLAFGRRQVLQPRTLDLNRLVASAETGIREAAGPGVDVRLRLDSTLGAVQADPSQIQQVILNLSANARDAMPRGGTLAIATRNVDPGNPADVPDLPGPKVLLEVADDGCGMSPEVQAHLFEPFFTTKEVGKGTGLGLATVYGIVQQSGGRIRVRSDVGKGAVFSIYLPRVGPATGSRENSTRPAGGRETILLVEDSDLIRRLVYDSLVREGYTVLVASDGQEALRLAIDHAGPIHLLVSDVIMPGMGGRELAERLAPTRPELRVLYMSGYTSGALSKDGILETGTELLEKPFTPKDLCRRIRQILERPDPTRTL